MIKKLLILLCCTAYVVAEQVPANNSTNNMYIAINNDGIFDKITKTVKFMIGTSAGLTAGALYGNIITQIMGGIFVILLTNLQPKHTLSEEQSKKAGIIGLGILTGGPIIWYGVRQLLGLDPIVDQAYKDSFNSGTCIGIGLTLPLIIYECAYNYQTQQKHQLVV